MSRLREPQENDATNKCYKQIWSCMERLQKARDGDANFDTSACGDVRLDEGGHAIDVQIDCNHVCTAECPMHRIDNKEHVLYRCTVSQNVHACGVSCRAYTVTNECYVCEITGACVGTEERHNYTVDDISGSSNRDGFEICAITNRMRRALSKERTRDAADRKQCVAADFDRMRMVARRTVTLLLCSETRSKLETQIEYRHSRVAHRQMAAYVRARNLKSLPIVLTDLQNLFVTEMHRTDGWMCSNAKPSSGRLQFLIEQCVNVQRMMTNQRVRAKLQSPIFQLGKLLQYEYFSLAILYIMRDGLRDSKDHVLVKRDAYLNKYLPNLNNLSVFGFRKPRFSHATACVRMALCLRTSV
ncbi:hypothetical protein CYMTET_40947 [Cymbomonas tetramitiformis]|uniref:Uncharacterized protein n=1 Tax=Cymbomonas tetramitiformis TaxID=36881 RepID=A0AAE0F359_9CHLO|nr:hypothetical protein CYMTET_40947 [Cymbomonas tetramitiformis]|eukprot:gene243-427_t